jgi:hypothetical protein
MEIEGKNISKESESQIVKLVNNSKYCQITAVASQKLIDYGVTNEIAPLAWKAICDSFLSQRSQILMMPAIKTIVINITEAGFKDELFWKEVNDFLVASYRQLDLQTSIELRNAYILNFPEEREMISFFE